MTASEPEPTVPALPPDSAPLTIEERLRNRVSMLTQLLIVAGVIVALQFGIMLKVLMDSSK